MIHKYYIFNSEFVMSGGNGVSVGSIAVNGFAYHVTIDSHRQTYVNGLKVGTIYSPFPREVVKFIAEHQRLTAWQLVEYGHDVFESYINSYFGYCAGTVDFHVYHSQDKTCWRYYADDLADDSEHASPWYPAEINPCEEHFREWIISTICIELGDE